MQLLIIFVEIVAFIALPLSLWVAKKSTAGAPSIIKHPDWRHGRWWTTIAAYPVLIAVALTPLLLLAGRLLLIPTQTVSYNVHRVIHDARLESVVSCPTSAQAVLALTLHNADVAQDTVEADASLCVGDQALRHLQFTATGVLPFAQGIKQQPTNKRALRATFAVIYDGSLPEMAWTRQVSISEMLKQREPLSRDREPIHVGTLTLPLLGNPGDYPLDTYSTAGLWVVQVPNRMQIVFPGSVRLSYIVTPRISVSPGTADLKWRWDNTSDAGLVLEASRSFPSQLFIIILLLLPILLFLGLLLTLIPRSAHESHTSSRLPTELLVGVGAFLLAVLPVRAVLVPSDVPRLTVVDYVLGTEMAVMVAATLILAIARMQTHGEADSPVLLNESFEPEKPPGKETTRPLTPGDGLNDNVTPRESEGAGPGPAEPRP